MKKKFLLIIFVIIVIILGLIIILNIDNGYIVKIDIVDLKSPDRVLVLYKDNKKVDFDSIYYLDNVYICNSETPYVAKSILKNVKRLKVKLKNGKVINVKVIEEEK